jgi:hypothetical protein
MPVREVCRRRLQAGAGQGGALQLAAVHDLRGAPVLRDEGADRPDTPRPICAHAVSADDASRPLRR